MMGDPKSEKLTVAVLDPFHPKIMDVIAAGLPAGWKLNVAAGADLDSRRAAIRDADILFIMATKMPASLLEEAPKLRFIQKLGAGLDNIDLEHCRVRGIGVARLEAGNAIPVAEHTLLLMLAAYRRLVDMDRQVRAGEWKREAARAVSRQIDGKTIGLIGFGAVGRALARLLLGFNVRIIYADPIQAPPDVEQELRAERMTHEEVLAQSDIVSLHLPLQDDTAGLISEAWIGLMKPGAVLINCARGGLVDEAALHRALVAGHLSGAAIDCFTNEPPTGSPLLAIDQTILTPHTAGGTVDNFGAVVERSVDNTCRYLAGEALSPKELIIGGNRSAAGL
jgi:phosphoglycerate dehydrogenase-like enzyme